MRWSIIRVIWMRELRDQLRDRRTIFMIAVLPLILYPLAGFGLIQLASGIGQKPQVVGVCGFKNLPAEAPEGHAALLTEDATGLHVAPEYLQDASPSGASKKPNATLEIRRLPDPEQPFDLAARRKPLDDHTVDLVVIVPNDFADVGEDENAPRSLSWTAKTTRSRTSPISASPPFSTDGKRSLRTSACPRDLPEDFDEPFKVDHPEPAGSAAERANTDLFSLLLRVFPFMLVMWSLAGALYPAVDLCAGEKERGTMETLLISPASREEIVWGKFLTIWVFSAATALLNLLSMGLTTWQFSSLHAQRRLPSPAVLLWGVLLLLPLSAFFSAVCLAVGAYARSSKEGQYYLMPLFLLTMPLIFLTLAPGVELNPFYSMVPVTGVALLLQKLIAASAASSDPVALFHSGAGADGRSTAGWPCAGPSSNSSARKCCSARRSGWTSACGCGGCSATRRRCRAPARPSSASACSWSCAGCRSAVGGDRSTGWSTDSASASWPSWRRRRCSWRCC